MREELHASFSDHLLTVDRTREQRRMYFACKRLFDIVVAGVLLFVLSPLMLAIALLVGLETPGPAFFKQKRVTLRKGADRPLTSWEIGTFNFYKFRSMYWHSDPGVHKAYVQALIQKDQETMAELQGEDTQVRKLVKDPRVTRVGAFLRKSSLDELPQLLNVLKGDMSLVGPRPPIPYEVEMYDAWHQRRLEAKPGLTGLWQVSARSSVDFDDMVRLDIEYIENQSFWLDLKILFRTPLAVLDGNGAV